MNRSGPPGTARARPPCNLCGAVPAVLYARGWSCPEHTPARLAGRPEPQPGPGWPPGAWSTPSPQAASALVDNRAVASGKRRASHQEYRAAQQAVAPHPATTSA